MKSYDDDVREDAVALLTDHEGIKGVKIITGEEWRARREPAG